MNRKSQQQDLPQEKSNSQIKALFLKSCLLQAKQPCTNICQIFTPVICLLFTYVIKILASDSLPAGAALLDNNYPYVFGDYTIIDNISKVIVNSTRSANPARNNPLQWFVYDCSSPSCNSTLLGVNEGGKQILNPDGTTILGSIINAPPAPSFVDNFTLNFYDDVENPFIQTKYFPFFLPSAYANVNTDIYNNIIKVQANSFEFIKKGRKGLDSIPDGSVTFNTLSNTSLDISLSVNDIRDLDMHRNNGISALIQSRKLKESGIWVSTQRDITTPYGILALQHIITEAYTYLLTKTNTQSGYIYMRSTDQSKSFVDSIINTTSALIFPLALSLLFPVMLYSLVLEKEQKLVQMMKMNGMKISNYWLVYFIYNFALTLTTNFIFFMVGAFVLKTNFFTKTSPFLLILVTMGWSLSQIGLASFLQTLLSKARSANIIGYIIAIWTMMIGSTLNIGVYQVPNEYPLWLQLIPPFSFNRLFYLMLMNCSDADCYNSMDEIIPQMKNCILFLYLGFFVFFLLGAYLLEVIPQQFGVSRPLLFPFTDFYNFVTCSNKVTYVKPEKDEQLKKYIGQNEEDPFSLHERETISRLKQTQDIPLIINNLRKCYQKQGYKGIFSAVKSFNLKVQAKETFGLLGPNGAGKTTLINMLTGMITPDYGNAWIGGYDIRTNISKSQLQMGVCPQFDLLWPQLTVEQHLRFYARLKGIPSSTLQKRIQEAIQEVKLSKFKNFLSSSLSGGMKRRLSIAISLVGDPKIVFLDEPSTGLDPDNRRQIWQVLANCQEKRSLFLTTHMMEQADALCHRIGIITHGTLRTVGNSLKLKKQYGQGFRLSLSFLTAEKQLISPNALNLQKQNNNLQNDRGQEQNLRKSISELIQKQSNSQNFKKKKGVKKITQVILQLFQGACLTRILGSSLIFKIPLTHKVSSIFTEMHNIEEKYKITNISITDSSLEDVFVAVVLKYDKILDDQNEENLLNTVTNNDEDDDDSDDNDKGQNQGEIKTLEKPPAAQGSIIEKSRQSVFTQKNEKENQDDQ